ncbi:uncharacterized protein VP01_2929g3 [Puccinia sorghi]|uniref:Uncharacterized protein n=1 Tax=Puccinia sorghi TaxID=27349 RepID=A0A0L6V1Z9_9BASI|nr:uncharacterized protein VP01_2929g3 [Puccinia sorghi]
MNQQQQLEHAPVLLIDQIDKLDRQMQATYRTIASILNYNLNTRSLNLAPFIQPNQLPPKELVDQLKTNVSSFDGTLQHIENIATIAIAITQRDLAQAIQSKTEEITSNLDQQPPTDHHESEIEILTNYPTNNQQPKQIINNQNQPIDLTSRSPTPQPQHQTNTNTPVPPPPQPNITTPQPALSMSLVECLIPSLDESAPDHHNRPRKQQPTPPSLAPIQIDLDRDSSPETPLNNATNPSLPTKPISTSPTGADPPGGETQANVEHKSTSDLTDGDMFADGSLFGSSHHGSVVPSPHLQHSSHPSISTNTNTDKDEGNTQPPVADHPSHSLSTSPPNENQPVQMNPSNTGPIPASSTPSHQPEPAVQITTVSRDPSSSTPTLANPGELLGASTMEMISTPADLSAFLSSFSHPSSSGPSASGSPIKPAGLERTPSGFAPSGLIGLGIDLAANPQALSVSDPLSLNLPSTSTTISSSETVAAPVTDPLAVGTAAPALDLASIFAQFSSAPGHNPSPSV